MSFLNNILGGILRFVYNMVSQIGAEPESISFLAISIIITTIIFKLLLLPVSLHQAKSSKAMNEIQPKMKEIQTKYKDDPKTMNMKMTELYREHNYNPASGCLILLVQFPIIIAFFAVMRSPGTYIFNDPDAFATLGNNFFWIKDLGAPDPYFYGLPLLNGIVQFFQFRFMTPASSDGGQAQSMNKTMQYFFPVMIFYFARSFPAGLALYWLVGNIFQIGQQFITNSSLKRNKEVV